MSRAQVFLYEKDERDFVKLRKKAGMKLVETCRYFHIPYNTAQKWEYGTAKCPQYLLALMEYKLKKNGYIE